MLLSAFVMATAINANAQQQPNNGDFELWDNVGTDTEEPTSWNNMMTGDLCTFCAFGASQRVFRDDSDVHGGTYSARIETTTAVGNIVNGAMTTGKIVVPSTTPSEGYSQTVASDPDFNHEFMEMPDSLVFWAKYSVTDNSDSARINLVLHDDYDLRDPQDGASASHVVGTAGMNFQTAGEWMRVSIPFDYSGPSVNSVAYALATFTSSYVAGSGNATAKLWVDDMEFIYNPTVTSVEETLASTLSVYPNPTLDGNINMDLGGYFTDIQVAVSNMMGQTVSMLDVRDGNSFSIQLDLPEGMYFLTVRTATGETATVRVVKAM